VAHVAPLKTEPGKADFFLRKWAVSVAEDGAAWEALMPRDIGVEFLLLAESEDRGMIDSADWPDIAEAIEDDRRAGPEQEFATNVIEHTRKDNLRLALPEAIIGLEIVMTGFLRAHLRVAKGLPNER
jgi:hypothetical protein